jgi:hypothetical protein
MSSIFADRFPEQKARPAAGTPFSWYVSGIVLAAVLGAAAALGDIDSKRGVVILILAFGVTGGLVLAFAPIRLVVGIFLFLTLVVVGPLVSIARFDQARWIPYMFALVLLLRVPMEWYHTSKTGGRSGFRRDKAISPVAGAIGWYFVLVLISVLTNLPPPTQVLVGAKAYLFIWGFFFLLAACSISPEMLERIWKSVLIVAILQVPFVVYQRLFEASRRLEGGGGIEALDAIVGTFPGTEGGGASGAMAFFCVFAAALALSLRRNKALGDGVAALVVVACVVALALGETKVIVVLFPLAFLVMNRGEVFRRPLYFLGMGVIVIAILGAILSFYAQQWRPERDVSTLDYLSSSVDYVTDPNALRANGHVGRTAALSLWYSDGRHTPQSLLFGYGPAASQASSAGGKTTGVIAARYAPLNVNSSAAAAMLWDIGVLGLVAFLAIPITAFFQGLRLSSVARIPAFHRGALEASALMMALAVVSVPYDKSLVFNSQLQVVFLMALFQIVYWRVRSDGVIDSPTPNVNHDMVGSRTR